MYMTNAVANAAIMSKTGTCLIGLKIKVVVIHFAAQFFYVIIVVVMIEHYLFWLFIKIYT